MCRIPVRSPMPNSPRKPLVDLDVLLISLITLPWGLAVFICLIISNFGETPEPSGNRQIILDVPRSSQVDAQVISGNNTVNLKNL